MGGLNFCVVLGSWLCGFVLEKYRSFGEVLYFGKCYMDWWSGSRHSVGEGGIRLYRGLSGEGG